MGIRNAEIHSLLDVTMGRNPDGTQAKITEVLEKQNPLFHDMSFENGNLDTGNRHEIRTKNADAEWVGYNDGISPSKGATRSVDEKAFYLESEQFVERKLAVMSGNVGAYREKKGIAHINGLGDKFAEGILYGNSAVNENQVTGLMTRFNKIGDQVIDAEGTGSRLRSILLVGWSTDTVTGIISKNGHSGLQHLDTTANSQRAPDGHPVGDRIDDGTGRNKTILAYTDRWSLEAGIAVKDPRFVVRAANIDLDTLTNDMTTGVDLEDLMIEMLGRFGATSADFARVNATFYMPRELQTWFRRQEGKSKRSYLGWNEIGGANIQTFDGAPIRRFDAMNVNESQVA